jgi:hypothetical protein
LILETLTLLEFGVIEIHTEHGETVAKSTLQIPQKRLIEDIVLSHAIEGVDVTSPTYISGLIIALRNN